MRLRRTMPSMTLSIDLCMNRQLVVLVWTCHQLHQATPASADIPTNAPLQAHHDNLHMPLL
uniref:Uncharacterized protein n=1 Tax=Oryza glumipatula TaxID=40148 RepID=A0A0E0BE09_9ORYZ